MQSGKMNYRDSRGYYVRDGGYYVASIRSFHNVVGVCDGDTISKRYNYLLDMPGLARPDYDLIGFCS
jgi:hypothetical protein